MAAGWLALLCFTIRTTSSRAVGRPLNALVSTTLSLGQCGQRIQWCSLIVPKEGVDLGHVSAKCELLAMSACNPIAYVRNHHRKQA